MKLNAAVRLLRLLNSQPEGALTAKQIARKWLDQTGTEMHIRSVQRHLSELCADSADGPALVEVDDRERELKYHLRLSQVAHWFMTEEAALHVLLTRQMLERSFATLDPAEAKRRADMAEVVSGDFGRTRRLRERLRIVPDGIGRLPAPVDAQVLASAVDALGANQKLSFIYVDSKGNQTRQVLSPQGLVAKDGTIYLLATAEASDAPRHFALHRVVEAHLSPHPLQAQPGFDLDRYIEGSHQLSHRLDADAAPVSLKLRVAPKALYHFEERPLSSDQTVEPSTPSDGWHCVTATVPETVLLVPFLMSMGPWIEVLGPPSVRGKTREWLRDAAAHYASDTST